MYDMGNKDGFGLMWVEKVDGVDRVVFRKSMLYYKALMELYEENMNHDIVIHLRNASYGMEKNLENCHPFKILSLDDGDKTDLYMMHNGRFNEIQVDKKMSDSWNFATKFLSGYLKKHPAALQDPDFQNFLAGIISPNNNKLVFLDNKKRFTIINADLGAMHPTGVWVSVKSEIKLPTYSPPAPPVTHINGQQFGSSKDADWTFSKGKWEEDSDNRLHFHADPLEKTINAKADAITNASTEDTTDNGTFQESPSNELDEAGLREVIKALPTMARTDIVKFVNKFHKETLWILKELHPTESEPKLRLMIAASPWDATDMMIVGKTNANFN